MLKEQILILVKLGMTAKGLPEYDGEDGKTFEDTR